MPSDIPFVAFGNDELNAAAPLVKGDHISCAKCGGIHVVGVGTDEKGRESDMLQFISCGESSYLVGVQGKSVMKTNGPFKRRPLKTRSEGK